jgi:hypothetical protein
MTNSSPNIVYSDHLSIIGQLTYLATVAPTAVHGAAIGINATKFPIAVRCEKKSQEGLNMPNIELYAGRIRQLGDCS